ncbi:DUF3037 domain-containing protein [Agaribacterium haliotis]|uniref:DUF3037 domain-containing protein n=1 Tax=Agaribacterium haliotis TaxID=2013869 RepID=UPI0013041BBB|nr:DUF3037 domain-containing protein [Agaribacterium haliotis]
MNKQLCRYAIIRFTPFVETEEFANIGVFMQSPKGLQFKLELRKQARITHFFDDLNPDVFRQALRELKQELERICELGNYGPGTKQLEALFNEVVRPRETLLNFSDVKAGLYLDPVKALDDVFSHFVRRNFVTPEYKEQAMEKSVRGILKEADLNGLYKRKELGDSLYKMTFPFVKQAESGTRAIKPLHLAYEKATDVINHGGQWLFKINELRNRNVLGENLLLTLDSEPANHDAKDAYHDIKRRFQRDCIAHTENSNRNEILTFARS